MGHHQTDDHKEPDAVTTADPARQAGVDRVAAWWPKGVTRGAQEPAEVSFARGAVGMVEQFSGAKDAGQMLSAVHRFAVWLVSIDGELQPLQSFTPEVLAAYRAQALAEEPRGTQDATLSRLRRVGAAVAADPAGAAAACKRATDPMTITALKERAQAATIERLIDTYAPETIATDRWERVRPVVLEAARSVQPASRDKTLVVLQRTAYLAGWVDRVGRALRRDVVFHPDTVEEFAAVLAGAMARTSAATISSTLRSVSRTLYPELVPASWTTFGRGSVLKDPYSPKDLSALVTLLDRERSPRRRRHLGALIWLVLATGAWDGEQNHVRLPDDVSRSDDGSVTVTLTHPATEQTPESVRHVVALATYSAQLWEVVEESLDRSDRWLLGGGATRSNRSSDLWADTVGSWRPALDAGRLRRTYLVALMAEPHSVPDLLAAAGVTTLAALDPLVELVSPGQMDTPSAIVATLGAFALEELTTSVEERRAQDDVDAGDHVEVAS